MIYEGWCDTEDWSCCWKISFAVTRIYIHWSNTCLQLKFKNILSKHVYLCSVSLPSWSETSVLHGLNKSYNQLNVYTCTHNSLIQQFFLFSVSSVPLFANKAAAHLVNMSERRLLRQQHTHASCYGLECAAKTHIEENIFWIKVVIFVFAHKKVLNVPDVLLSMEGQKALGFHQKYLNLCSEDERRSYGFGTT